jgi:LysR family tcuABC transcriptional regulator
MELRQLRYFVRVVELGSISRAALDLNLVQSALSQQITRLEGELSTRLLQRSPQGVTPTEAGVAFFREAQLTLRHAEQAIRAAQQARLSGTVSVGLAPTTAAVLGLPLMQAMRERYPDVRLHMVESLSGHLASMLNARQLDLAILFNTEPGRRWSVMPLLSEKLYLIQSRQRPLHPAGTRSRLADLTGAPLILPTGPHGLRSALDLGRATGHQQSCVGPRATGAARRPARGRVLCVILGGEELHRGGIVPATGPPRTHRGSRPWGNSATHEPPARTGRDG